MRKYQLALSFFIMFSCGAFAASNQHIKLEGIEGESEDARTSQTLIKTSTTTQPPLKKSTQTNDKDKDKSDTKD